MLARHYLHLGTDLNPAFASAMRATMQSLAPLDHVQWGELMTALCGIAE